MNMNVDELIAMPTPQPKEDVMAYHLNHIIQFGGVNTNLVSDGFHTFGELYEHRITLFITLCYMMQGTHEEYVIWKSKLHHDGTSFDGWFIMGIGKEKGAQISYHLPMSKWDECDFVPELDNAPEWDGHSSGDALNRLKGIYHYDEDKNQ